LSESRKSKGESNSRYIFAWLWVFVAV